MSDSKVTVETVKPAKAPIVTSTAPQRQPPSPERVDSVEKAFAPFLDRMGPQTSSEEPAPGTPAETPKEAPKEGTAPEPHTHPAPVEDKSVALLEEKLKAIRENNAAKRAKHQLTREQADLEAKRQQHNAEVQRLKALGLDPSMTPAQMHEHLQNRALAEKDPVLQNAMRLEEERKRREALQQEVQDLKNQRLEEQRMTARQRAQQTILSLAKDSKYALLHEYLMNDSEILTSADYAADSVRAKLGDNFSEADVVNEMLRTIQERDNHFKARRNPQGSNGASPQPNGTPETQVAANPLNPALSDRRDSGQRPLSPKERAALIERQFEPYLKKRGYRSE